MVDLDSYQNSISYYRHDIVTGAVTQSISMAAEASFAAIPNHIFNPTSIYFAHFFYSLSI